MTARSASNIVLRRQFGPPLMSEYFDHHVVNNVVNRQQVRVNNRRSICVKILMSLLITLLLISFILSITYNLACFIRIFHTGDDKSIQIQNVLYGNDDFKYQHCFDNVYIRCYSSDPNCKYLTVTSRIYDITNIHHWSELIKVCEEKLISQISLESICNSVIMAKSYGGVRLMAASLKFIRLNRGDSQLPLAQLWNLTDGDGNFILNIVVAI